ncbi:MAG: serine hydrolase domain-containing protein [Caulobacteraceae bacterium]
MICKRSFFRPAFAAALLLASSIAAQTPSETKPVRPPAAAATAAPTARPAPAAAPTLNKQDLDAWLDGFMPYALSSGDIAGAVVVVVKDGRVLTEKGYGFADVKSRRPVDPATTLFRPGSVSKLFTWTAVMQQVEAGKIDLDANVNRYLDFKIPPFHGQPVTMRDLMTHTAGFAETIKYLFPAKAADVLPLGKLLSRWVPNRIYPPGDTPAYSNYGAALAGYIVQRVSGEPFDTYIERHIFAPLGMTHSTFRQPPPAALLANTSLAYLRASTGARPYEFIGPGPAGSLAATGDDMARFMIAHLNGGAYGGARIHSQATAQQMHAPQVEHTPPLTGMALGFYHEDRHGHVIIGHAGDTEAFHSDLHLLLNDGVGLFLSMNSQGKEGAAHTVRGALLDAFMDRYYPAPATPAPTVASAKVDAAKMQGTYWSSRRVDSGFLRLINLLNQTKVIAQPDGTLVVTDFKDDAGAPLVWREVAPFVWKDASGRHMMAAALKDGKVEKIGYDFTAAFMDLLPVPFAMSSSWNMPLLLGMVAVLLAAVLLWPVQALVRRRHRASFPLSGTTARLYRAVRIAALIDLVALAGYVVVVQMTGANLALFGPTLDPWLRLLQILCIVGVAGAILGLWNTWRVWTEPGRSWWAKTSVTVIELALLAFVWFVVTLQLVTVSLNY